MYYRAFCINNSSKFFTFRDIFNLFPLSCQILFHSLLISLISSYVKITENIAILSRTTVARIYIQLNCLGLFGKSISRGNNPESALNGSLRIRRTLFYRHHRSHASGNPFRFTAFVARFTIAKLAESPQENCYAKMLARLDREGSRVQ